MEVVAVNDLGDVNNLAYLLKYDSAYGRWGKEVSVKDGKLMVEGNEVHIVSQKEPKDLPWKDLNVDVVVESTGFFTDYAKARAHIDAGAKRVVITAPAKGEGGKTVLMGVNEGDLATCEVSSNGSCTTNATSPVVQVLHEAFGVKKAMLSTTHAYTASQAIVDGPKGKDVREGRAAAANIVPTSTGAAISVTQAITDLVGKFDGISLRVPVIVGSIADNTMLLSRSVTKEEVNETLRKASQDKRWEGILGVTDEELVSSDIKGITQAALVDLTMTRVVDGDLVKVLSWYDNEMGYTSSLIQHVSKIAQYIK